MATVFLVGFMGSGKTSVGLELARRRGCPLVDLDDRLAARFGCTIPEIFERWGEPAFRVAELDELARVGREGPVVVATGGGTYCSAAAQETVRRCGGVAVYLEVAWEDLLARVGAEDPDRPMWTGPDAARKLFERRLPHYRAADLVVRLDPGDTPASVAERVAALLEEARCAT